MAKILIIAGVVLIAVGLAWLVGERFGLGGCRATSSSSAATPASTSHHDLDRHQHRAEPRPVAVQSLSGMAISAITG
jgi:hypothetical protein